MTNRTADKPLGMAYECHREYLDADSAISGPIEDYIAAAIRKAALRCAEICKTEEVLLPLDAWETRRNVSAATAQALGELILLEFGLPKWSGSGQDQPIETSTPRQKAD